MSKIMWLWELCILRLWLQVFKSWWKTFLSFSKMFLYDVQTPLCVWMIPLPGQPRVIFKLKLDKGEEDRVKIGTELFLSHFLIQSLTSHYLKPLFLRVLAAGSLVSLFIQAWSTIHLFIISGFFLLFLQGWVIKGDFDSQSEIEDNVYIYLF